MRLTSLAPALDRWLAAPALQPPPQTRPLFLSPVRAGFPSPADDYVEERIDLNEHLVKHPAATFFLRVKGHSMIGAGIFDHDLVVVDRSLAPVHGAVVIAVIDGELTVKRLALLPGGGVELRPENPEFPVLRLREFQELNIWGVVTDVIHSVRP
jgi:DNA polymerase V